MRFALRWRMAFDGLIPAGGQGFGLVHGVGSSVR
jgi:hypothetical protein